MLDKSLIGMVCRSSRVTNEAQITALRKAGAEWIVELGRVVPKSWRDVASIVSKGDTLHVYGLALVPTKRGDDVLSPSAQASEFIMEVHERGGTVVEVSTGRSSRNRSQRQAMIKDAAKALRRGNRTPPTGRGRGRPKTEWPADTVTKAKAVWFSRHYVSNVAAAAHLPEGMTAKHAWQLFGASGRPYKSKRK